MKFLYIHILKTCIQEYMQSDEIKTILDSKTDLHKTNIDYNFKQTQIAVFLKNQNYVGAESLTHRSTNFIIKHVKTNLIYRIYTFLNQHIRIGEELLKGKKIANTLDIHKIITFKVSFENELNEVWFKIVESEVLIDLHHNCIILGAFNLNDPINELQIKNFTNNPFVEIKKIALDLLQALEELSKHNLAHNDVCPDNIMLKGIRTNTSDDVSYKYVLVDYESITVKGVPLAHSGIYVNEKYASPEMLNDFVASEKSDIYSYGLTLLAFYLKHINSQICMKSNYIPIKKIYPNIKDHNIRDSINEYIQDEEFKLLIIGCTELDIAKRYSFDTIRNDKFFKMLDYNINEQY